MKRTAVTTLLLLLTLLLPAGAVGQSASNNSVKDWERNRQNVLAYLDAMPETATGFQPTPGVRTFAQQFDHIVTTNLEVAAVALKGAKKPPALGDSTRYLHDKKALKAYAEASYTYVLDALRQATPAALARTLPLYGQPAQPATRWMELSLEHSVWTLGQVVPYLRLNHATPPAYNMPF